MAKSRDELIERALKNLGALPAGQTANGEEYDSVQDLVTPTLESLSERDIYYVEDENAIEDKAFLALGHCLAWAAAPEFGLQSDAGMMALNEMAELHLKAIGSEPPTYKILEVNAF